MSFWDPCFNISISATSPFLPDALLSLTHSLSLCFFFQYLEKYICLSIDIYQYLYVFIYLDLEIYVAKTKTDSTTRDMMELIKLFFRQNGARGGRQIVEGQSIRGMMLPRYIYPDRRSGFATPFELYWNFNDLLLHTKRGDISGYRSVGSFYDQKEKKEES